MTIVRRRADTLDAIALPMPAIPSAPPLVRPTGVAAPSRDVPAPEVTVPVGRLRRCTFRRMDLVEDLPGRAPHTTYEVMCLYAGVESPLPLGDIAAARPICESCTATGIFRPDES